MSSSVVLESAPDIPPTAVAPAVSAAPPPPVHHHLAPTPRSPVRVVSVSPPAATTNSAPPPPPVDNDVQMTSDDAENEDDAVTAAAVAMTVDSIKEEVAARAEEAAAAASSSTIDCEQHQPELLARAAAPPPIEYTVRSPADDARALALATRRLAIQISFVESARQKILDESHPDFMARMAAIDAARDQQLARARGNEEYWAHCTSVIFAYECEEASSEFLMNCDRLRNDMLDEIHQEMEILQDQRKGSSSARKTTRKTRSTRAKAGGDDKSLASGLETTTPAQKVKKRMGTVFPQLENKLAPSEVDHDLRELANSLEIATKKRRMDVGVGHATESPFVAKYHRSNFLYRDFVFQEGDELFVRNLMTGSDFIAIICSITSTELFVLSEMGKYARLVFMDLRQGRVTVSPLTPEQTAALNDREASRR